MRLITDHKLNGFAAIFDGLNDIVASAEAHRGRSRYSMLDNSAEWIGGVFRNWKDVRSRTNEPNPMERARVEQVQAALEKSHLPSPVSRARKHRWSEDDGEVDSDRVLRGESDFYRETYRTQKTGTQHVSILMKIGGNCHRSSDSLFWSSAAAIAVVDKLEEAGFSCEVWGYNWSSSAYESGKSWFLAARLKEAGDPLTVESLITVGSGWFFRTAGIQAQDDVPGEESTGGYGCSMDIPGGWIKYVESAGSIQITLRNCDDLSSAVHCATKAIETVNNQSTGV